ncbi:MAG: glycosyltransferase family 39 protein [Bacteroidetes bacterium]|nr:glycosyltransferase family 39 protein [Bacteroidota bacterium]
MGQLHLLADMQQIIQILRKPETAVWVLFLAAAYFLIFLHLDHHPLYVWDEGLFANRAYFWAEHGKYFTNWLEVDNCDLNHPNTKPPLMSIVQALSFKMFGYNRLALRIPIAITGLLTCLAIILLAKKALKNVYAGFVMAIMLLTASAYNDIHILKSGDHDTAVAFFLFASTACFFIWLHLSKKLVWMLGFFAFTAFAILTKSIAGVLMIPGIGLYLLLSGHLVKVLSNRHTYWGLGLMLLLIAGFYGIMEINQKGFLALVFEHEIKRFGSVVDSHDHPWYYYIKHMAAKSTFWFVFLTFGIVGGFISRQELAKKLVLFFGTSGLVYLIMISAASTKLHWYAAPLYPIMALIAGFGFYFILFELLAPLASNKGFNKAPVILAFVLLIGPLYNTIKDKYKPQNYWNVVEYEQGLWQLKKHHPEYKTFKVHTRREWYPNLIFMVNLFNDHYGYDLEIMNSGQDIKVGDLLYGHKHERFKNYEMEKVVDLGPIEIRKVLAIKNKE